jgi:TRAP-type mannitol/chloroaromatic compound transport system substrate-binding protein/uncharacterized caspase-like protein
MHLLVAFLLGAGVCLAASGAAAQDTKRIALLIGNQAYDASVGRLKNPHNDIALVGQALAAQGFEVLTPIKDARRSAILGGVRELVRRLNAAGSGSIGFLYYSGHGAAEKDTSINYLIPVDAKEPGTVAFWDESLKLDDVLKLLDGARGAAKFVVFDACRNELQLPTKDTTKGLIPVAEQSGMFIAYASAPGRTASDRGDRSGPYAAALAAELGKAGLDHLNLFQNVKEAVLSSTGGVQQPWESNGLGRRVYLTGAARPVEAPKAAPVPPSAPAASEAERAWAWVKDTTDQRVLDNFIKQFGTTEFGLAARTRLAELKRLEVPKPATPAPASSSPPTPTPSAPTLALRQAPRTFRMASPLILKLQNTFAEADTLTREPLHAIAGELARLSGGNLKLDLLAAGAVVPSFQAMDALGSGALDAAWTQPSYWYGKSKAFGIFAGTVPLGLEPAQFVRWMEAEGANELNRLIREVAKQKVRSLPCAVLGPGSDWYKTPIRHVDDLKGLKFRMVGLPMDAGTKLGMTVAALPGGEIVPALERGLINGSDWLPSVSAIVLGLPDVAKHAYSPSWSRPAHLLELMVSEATWNKLNAQAQEGVEAACWQNVRRTLERIPEIERRGAQELSTKWRTVVQPYPPAVLEGMRSATQQVLNDMARQDPNFARVLASYNKYR